MEAALQNTMGITNSVVSAKGEGSSEEQVSPKSML